MSQDSTTAQQYGVKGSCPLSESLQHFHVVTGYPPDLLHNLLEGIVPMELALCLKALICKGIISLEALNDTIRQFPYTFSDRTNQPQLIPKTFSSKATIGGNGHENWTLLRLLPLLIGQHVPEGDETWEVLMTLKASLKSLCAFLVTKSLNTEINFRKFSRLKSCNQKNHYIEHYPQLIRAFGPLSDVWTMRFEGKHKFFTKVVCPAHNL